MSEKRHRLPFATDGEALAFIEGIEFVDSDHITTEGPEVEFDDDGTPMYTVYVQEFS
jgi:hypothetical protein